MEALWESWRDLAAGWRFLLQSDGLSGSGTSHMLPHTDLLLSLDVRVCVFGLGYERDSTDSCGCVVSSLTQGVPSSCPQRLCAL